MIKKCKERKTPFCIVHVLNSLNKLTLENTNTTPIYKFVCIENAKCSIKRLADNFAVLIPSMLRRSFAASAKKKNSPSKLDESLTNFFDRQTLSMRLLNSFLSSLVQWNPALQTPA